MARVVLGFAVTRAVAFPGSLVVTILYWGVVYPYGAADLQPLSFFTHGFNVVAMVTDSLISKARLPLLHGLYFISYCVLYLIWTIVFFYTQFERPCACPSDTPGCTDQGDTASSDECRYIYSSINWASRRSSAMAGVLVAIVLLVVAPLVVLVVFFMDQAIHYTGDSGRCSCTEAKKDCSLVGVLPSAVLNGRPSEWRDTFKSSRVAGDRVSFFLSC